MHQAGRPGRTPPRTGGGPSRTPVPDPPRWVMPGKAPWGQKAVWVTVADESSWDVLRAETPEEKALIRVFAS